MRFKPLVAIFTVCLLVMQPFSSSSSTNDVSPKEEDALSEGSYSEKSEVVYATLDATGKQKGMYVINSFSIDEPGKMVDYGPYTRVKNLTNLTDMKTSDQQVSFKATGDQFYYQGNLEGKPLPWDIHVSYQLNGESIPPEELLGKDGRLEIHIDTKANENADPVFFENYMLQISLPFDTDIYQSIETEDGTIADSGKSKQVTFTVMPEKEESFVIKADVKNLEMESIQIAAMPASMSLDTPNADDVTDDMKSLSDATEAINEGVGELNEGIAELNDGAESLQKGSASYKKGIHDLADRSSKLIEGSGEMKETIDTISQSLESNADEMNVSQLKELRNGLTEMAKGLEKTEDGLSELKENYTKAYTVLDQSIHAIPTDVADEDLAKLKERDSEVIEKLIETYKAAHAAKETYSNVKGAFKAVTPTLEGVIESLREMRTNIDTMADRLGEGLDNMNVDESMKQLQRVFNKISSNYQSFHSGLVDYTDGVSELSTSYDELHEGMADLTDGTSELENGVNELHEGTTALAESTNDLPDQIQTEIDQMMNEYDKSDFDPVSFVSSKNEKVTSVQFVIKTESIKKDDDEQETNQQEEEGKRFWERLLDLFR